MNSSPILEVVVTARPSWARVKHLVLNYASLHGPEKIRVSLVGPAVSKRYGDISKQIPDWLKVFQFPALHDSDELDAVALTCIEGANALVRHWAQNRPDCVLVIADRTETLGVSMSAALMQIPLIHLQGGEISGSIDDKIRDTNSKLADFHLTTNEFTKKRLVEIGEPEDLIRVVGCPSIDIVNDVMNLKDRIQLTQEELSGVGNNFDLKSKYGIVMFHPDTLNESQNMIWIKEIINSIEISGINWFWFWPNPDHGTNSISKEIRHSREVGKLERVKFIINLPPEKFVQLVCNSKIMVGNSSFGIRESSFLGLPVVNIGKRQNGRQRSLNVIDLEDSTRSSELSSIIKSNLENTYPQSTLYGDGTSGFKAAKCIGEWVPKVKIRKI